MIDVLIVDKNINYCKRLINELCKRNYNVRICGIANNVTEMLELIKNKYYDFILIDINVFDYKIIMSKKISFESIILMVDPKLESNFNINIKKAYESVQKIDDFNKVIENINLIFNSKKLYKYMNVDEEKIIKVKIKEEIKLLGYNMEHIGTKYLIETIYIIYSSKNYTNINLLKDIYPIVAKKYGKTVNNIKCNIRNATDIMYFDNEEEVIKKYLENYKNCKFGSKIVIEAILEKIKS